jgi:hypothetical protein
MIRTSRDGLELLILRLARSSSPRSSAQVGCCGIRQSRLSANCEHVYALDQFHAAAQQPLRSRKPKICSTDHAHRIRTAKANNSRRAARTPEHISHLKVMIILGGLVLSVRPAAP